MRKPINVLTGLDYWLDNLMCNVPELAMCYHLNGIVQVNRLGLLIALWFHLKWKRLGVNVPSHTVSFLSVLLPERPFNTPYTQGITMLRHGVTSWHNWPHDNLMSSGSVGIALTYRQDRFYTLDRWRSREQCRKEMKKEPNRNHFRQESSKGPSNIFRLSFTLMIIYIIRGGMGLKNDNKYHNFFMVQISWKCEKKRH